jgi:hypothetical protein
MLGGVGGFVVDTLRSLVPSTRHKHEEVNTAPHQARWSREWLIQTILHRQPSPAQPWRRAAVLRCCKAHGPMSVDLHSAQCWLHSILLMSMPSWCISHSGLISRRRVTWEIILATV